MMPPLDFEKIMLIGFNENLFDYDEQEDKKYAKMLVEQDFVVRPLSVRPRLSRRHRPFSLRPSRRPSDYYVHESNKGTSMNFIRLEE